LHTQIHLPLLGILIAQRRRIPSVGCFLELCARKSSSAAYEGLVARTVAGASPAFAPSVMNANPIATKQTRRKIALETLMTTVFGFDESL
jgi:hypothetical protein